MAMEERKAAARADERAPTCFRCGKVAEKLDEFVNAAREEWLETGVATTPTEWMKRNEGTFNPATNHFACTRCYIAIGMPVADNGWKAP